MSKRTIIHITDAHISKAYSSQTSEMLKLREILIL